jgi:hypothetical protein
MRPLFLPTACVLALALTRPSHGKAQVVARLGAPSEDIDAQVILEAPASALSAANIGRELPIEGGLPKFSCENVRVMSLALKATRVSGKPTTIAFRVTLNARPGHDKSVTLRLQVLENGVPLSSALVRNIEVQEGAAVVREGRFEMPASWNPPDTGPTLRLTVSVKNI